MHTHTHTRMALNSSHSQARLRSGKNLIFNSVTRPHMETIKKSYQTHERMSGCVSSVNECACEREVKCGIKQASF